VKPGQTSDAVWTFWDFLPTAAELAGTKAPAGLDGVSFVPALHGKPMPPREYLYWEFHERGFTQAVRLGDWKGVRRLSRRSPIELYDLKSDVGEDKDVAAAHPDVVRRIDAIMQKARADSKQFPVQER
jgi:arylsulfatase A-like enzyme